MKLKMRYGLILIFFLLSAALVFSGGQQEETFTHFSIGANYMGGTVYQWGAGVSEVLGDEMPDLNVVAEETGGMVDNINLLLEGSIDTAFCHAGLTHEAYLGEGKYEGQPKGKFYSWLAMPAMKMTIFTKADSDIDEFEDLEGKRVGIGQVEGSGYVDSMAVLEVAGLDDKIESFEVNIAEQGTMMTDNQIDAGMWCGIPQVPALLELAAVEELKYISVPDEYISELEEEYPYYYETELEEETYPGISESVHTFAVQTVMPISKDVPEDVVYEATKAVFENLDKLRDVHHGFDGLSKETVLQGMSIPIHPGALKYYREIEVPGIEDFVEKTKDMEF